MSCSRFRRDELRHVHAQRFGPAVAGDPLAGRIDGGEIPAQIVRIDNIVGVFKQIPIALLAGAQGLLGAPPIRDIDSCADDVRRRALLVAQGDIRPIDQPQLAGARLPVVLVLDRVRIAAQLGKKVFERLDLGRNDENIPKFAAAYLCERITAGLLAHAIESDNPAKRI